MSAGLAPEPPSVAEVVADPAFPRLKAMVIEITGMAFYRDKTDDFARIVRERMGPAGATDCAGYLELLRTAGAGGELDALVAELTIGETYFFRHKEQFDALRDIILPEVIERNRPLKRLNVWSAGCATGPEPYSVAIMLEREFGASIADWQVTVLGTDINRKFLARAREGRYDEWAFRTVPEHIRAACFTKVGAQWQINPEYRRVVKFQYHNLIKGKVPPMAESAAGFDIIICRNVIIYFSPDTVEALIPNFHQALTDGGWLVMGHAEPNQHLFRDFRTVNAPGAVLYKRDDRRVSGPAVAMPAPLPATAVMVPAGARITVAAWPRRPSRPPPAQPEVEDGGATHIRRLADGGQWERAAAECDALLSRTPLDALAHFYRALIHEQAGQAEEAEKALRRAIYLDRRLVLPHYHLGMFLSRRGESRGAARSFRNVLALIQALPDDHVVADADEITVGRMREAVDMHLKLLGDP